MAEQLLDRLNLSIGEDIGKICADNISQRDLEGASFSDTSFVARIVKSVLASPGYAKKIDQLASSLSLGRGREESFLRQDSGGEVSEEDDVLGTSEAIINLDSLSPLPPLEEISTIMNLLEKKENMSVRRALSLLNKFKASDLLFASTFVELIDLLAHSFSVVESDRSRKLHVQWFRNLFTASCLKDPSNAASIHSCALVAAFEFQCRPKPVKGQTCCGEVLLWQALLEFTQKIHQTYLSGSSCAQDIMLVGTFSALRPSCSLLRFTQHCHSPLGIFARLDPSALWLQRLVEAVEPELQLFEIAVSTGFLWEVVAVVMGRMDAIIDPSMLDLFKCHSWWCLHRLWGRGSIGKFLPLAQRDTMLPPCAYPDIQNENFALERLATFNGRLRVLVKRHLFYGKNDMQATGHYDDWMCPPCGQGSLAPVDTVTIEQIQESALAVVLHWLEHGGTNCALLESVCAILEPMSTDFSPEHVKSLCQGLLLLLDRQKASEERQFAAEEIVVGSIARAFQKVLTLPTLASCFCTVPLDEPWDAYVPLEACGCFVFRICDEIIQLKDFSDSDGLQCTVQCLDSFLPCLQQLLQSPTAVATFDHFVDLRDLFAKLVQVYQLLQGHPDGEGRVLLIGRVLGLFLTACSTPMGVLSLIRSDAVGIILPEIQARILQQLSGGHSVDPLFLHALSQLLVTSPISAKLIVAPSFVGKLEKLLELVPDPTTTVCGGSIPKAMDVLALLCSCPLLEFSSEDPSRGFGILLELLRRLGALDSPNDDASADSTVLGWILAAIAASVKDQFLHATSQIDTWSMVFGFRDPSEVQKDCPGIDVGILSALSFFSEAATLSGIVRGAAGVESVLKGTVDPRALYDCVIRHAKHHYDKLDLLIADETSFHPKAMNCVPKPLSPLPSVRIDPHSVSLESILSVWHALRTDISALGISVALPSVCALTPHSADSKPVELSALSPEFMDAVKSGKLLTARNWTVGTAATKAMLSTLYSDECFLRQRSPAPIPFSAVCRVVSDWVGWTGKVDWFAAWFATMLPAQKEHHVSVVEVLARFWQQPRSIALWWTRGEVLQSKRCDEFRGIMIHCIESLCLKLIPGLFTSLRALGLSIGQIVMQWIKRCFIGVIPWSMVSLYISLVATLGPEWAVFFAVAVLRQLGRFWEEGTAHEVLGALGRCYPLCSRAEVFDGKDMEIALDEKAVLDVVACLAELEKLWPESLEREAFDTAWDDLMQEVQT